MKKEYILMFVLGLVFFLLFGAFTRDWNEAVPTDSTVANQIDEYNRYLRVDTSDRLENMFYGFIAGENTLSQHCQYLQFYEQASVSQPSAGYGRLYTKAVGGKCELHWQDEDGDEPQLTSGGKWNGAVLLAASIPSGSYAADSIDSADYAADSIDAEHLAADIIDETKIADNGIDSEHYNDGSIDPEHIHTDVRIKGWVNFNGTGTLAVRDSYNVSSVTDSGTGYYTVNWDTDFADANYSVTVMSSSMHTVVIAQAAGTTQIKTYNESHAAADSAIVCVMAIGDQ